jgi:hypothetical protein
MSNWIETRVITATNDIDENRNYINRTHEALLNILTGNLIVLYENIEHPEHTWENKCVMYISGNQYAPCIEFPLNEYPILKEKLLKEPMFNKFEVSVNDQT